MYYKSNTFDRLWKQDYQHSQFTCSVDLDNENMCEPFCICCECGVILFLCDVKWVDSSRRATKFEKLSYGLMIEQWTRMGWLKWPVVDIVVR